MKLPVSLVSALALSAATALTASPALAAGHAEAEAQTLELSRQSIALRSVQGPGNETPKVAALYRDTLVKAGWAPADIEIVPVDDTAYMIATWKGSDPRLKPLVLSGHMDVVEAKREDWVRDPFVPVVENGYLYGRGALDMKFNAALAVSTLIEMRHQGFKPRRTILIAFSGDEETNMKTGEIIAKRLKNAGLVINVDGGGGMLDETTGKPLAWTWEGAEKNYADFQLEVTNPGGHSSAPRKDNAIVQLSQALVNIGAYHFTPEQSPLTKAFFESAAKITPEPKLAAAMRAFAANPADPAAIATLRALPEYIGRIETTCVPTMVNGGHALNALPQRATANVNCRIFPGHKREDIMAELARVANDPAVKVSDVTQGSTPSPASPMRADFLKATDKAIHQAYPGIAVIPAQSSGASDSMWYRVNGVDSYGAAPVLIKGSEEFAHGLNERVPLSNIAPGVVYFTSLFTDLAK